MLLLLLSYLYFELGDLYPGAGADGSAARRTRGGRLMTEKYCISCYDML